jgi:uncharacterized Zn finger protein
LLKIATSSGNIDYKALKKRITSVTPKKQLYRYKQVRDYFARIEDVSNYLADCIEYADAKKLFALVDYFLQRIETALDYLDDSGGYRFDSISQLHEIYIPLLAKTQVKPKQLAEQLLAKLVSGDDEIYPSIPFEYTEILGEQGLDHFWSILQQHWDQLPSCPNNSDIYYQQNYFSFASLLTTKAEQENNWQRLIEIKNKTASTSHDFLRIAKICFQARDYQQALDWLNKAESTNTVNRPISEVLQLQAQIKLKLGNKDSALEYGWKLFTTQPSMSTYSFLLKLTGTNKKQKSLWKYRVIEHLENGLKTQKSDQNKQFFWDSSNSSLLVNIHLKEAQLEPAWAIAKAYDLNENTIIKLATKSRQEFPKLAIYAFKQVIERTIQRTNNQAYQDAIDHLISLQPAMEEVGFRQYLDQLKGAFKAKRNFIKGLNTRFDLKS